MPFGLPVKSFYRRSGEGRYERDAQTAITVPMSADLLVTNMPLNLQALLAAQAQSISPTTAASNVDVVEAIGDDFGWIDELFQPIDTGGCTATPARFIPEDLGTPRRNGIGHGRNKGVCDDEGRVAH